MEALTKVSLFMTLEDAAARASCYIHWLLAEGAGIARLRAAFTPYNQSDKSDDKREATERTSGLVRPGKPRGCIRKPG
jgi:hypothetical protein